MRVEIIDGLYKGHVGTVIRREMKGTREFLRVAINVSGSSRVQVFVRPADVRALA